MKKVPKILLFLVLILFLVAGMMSSASAITITPNTQVHWSGTSPSNPKAGDIPGIVGYPGILDELYKQDVGGLESGDFASSYETTFKNTETDPQGADITYVGGDYISGDPLYLLVKDGNQNPIWYIFDLINLDLDDNGSYEYSWNGTDPIELSGFWTGQGAISHISIYGTPVPEPSTMLLFGTSFLGLAMIGRKTLFKKS